MIDIKKCGLYLHYRKHLLADFNHIYRNHSRYYLINNTHSRFQLNFLRLFMRCCHSFSNNSKTSQKQSTEEENIERIRNIGIIAHVDAGKTTTTERMLYYSGSSRFLGEVDHGDTVTDYMKQERERGITITSAAVTFHWKNYKINLIDTPGHIDFTMEVERALCALDGAVIILDASAGVQAQTLTVCRQANRLIIPQIAYLNKMDKPKSDIKMCLESIRNKLRIQPLLLHYPLYKNGTIIGVVDLVSLKCVTWNRLYETSGKSYEVSDLTESSNKELWLKMMQKRRELIENVADLDDDIAEHVLSHECWENLDATKLKKSLKRITLKRTGLLILCGSSFKNVGVQLLMDSITDYLPSPLEQSCKNVEFYNENLCALLFKIIVDKQKGFLLFLRIYKGTLQQGQKIYNVNKDVSEKVGKLYTVYANEFREIEKVSEGNIVAATGLKMSITGDTIVADSNAAKKAMEKYNKTHEPKDTPPFLGDLHIPDPVFFCSIEPSSLIHQKPMEIALECLKREDPSLQVKHDEATGQNVLSGMGELHLSIIEDRIKNEYKADVNLGPLQVAYKETVETFAEQSSEINRTIGDVSSHVFMKLSVEPSPTAENKFELMRTRENKDNLAEIRRSHLQAIENGIKMGLQYGPILGFPISSTLVGLHWVEIKPRSALTVISALASQCLMTALKAANPKLLEPYMELEVTTPGNYSSAILSDLTQRRGQIIEINARDDMKIINILVPLAELMGYSSVLRKISSGLASFTMEFRHYEPMSMNDQREAIKRITGF